MEKNLKLGHAEKAEFLEAARLAASWLANTQQTPAHNAWGRVHAKYSADKGRLMEKCVPSRDFYMPAHIWVHAIGLMGLLDMARTPVTDLDLYSEAARRAAEYLARSQCYSVLWPRAIGGFHECGPGDPYSAPRDGATACMGLIALYRSTGNRAWLDNAVRFAQWYSTHGSDSDGYPWDDYSLEKGEGTSKIRGDWQAGGALVYFQLFRLTGDERWKTAFRKVLDVLMAVCASADPARDTAYMFHGQCILSVGNDDFANTALLAGYRLFNEKRCLDIFASRMLVEWARQAESGAFPGYGGTFVTALEMLEALEFHAAGMPILPEPELRERLLRAARFTLALQERGSAERFLHGGVYGECNYGLSRQIIHARDTTYGIQLWLRLAGYPAPAYGVMAWERA